MPLAGQKAYYIISFVLAGSYKKMNNIRKSPIICVTGSSRLFFWDSVHLFCTSLFFQQLYFIVQKLHGRPESRSRTTEMAHPQTSDIVIYLCKNCIPQSTHIPAQWTEQGLHVRTKEIPCSGKIDAQYMLHAMEGGVRGLCVVTCPVGECTLAQGNYRSDMRVKTVRRLLSEIGLDPQIAELVRCPKNATPEQFIGLLHDAACRLAGLAAAANSKKG